MRETEREREGERDCYWFDSQLIQVFCYLIQSDLSPITSCSRALNVICPEHVDPLSIRHLGKEEGNNKERISANSDSYMMSQLHEFITRECLTKQVLYSGLIIVYVPGDLLYFSKVKHESPNLQKHMKGFMHQGRYQSTQKSLLYWKQMADKTGVPINFE